MGRTLTKNEAIPYWKIAPYPLKNEAPFQDMIPGKAIEILQSVTNIKCFNCKTTLENKEIVQLMFKLREGLRSNLIKSNVTFFNQHPAIQILVNYFEPFKLF